MNSLFFVASKTIGMAARAETWLLVCLALAFLALWRGRAGFAKVLILIGFVATLGLTIFPWGSALIAALESQYPARPTVDHVDTIIVLGGDEDLPPYRRWGGVQVNAAGERLIEGLALSRQFPRAKLVYTGGIGKLGATSGQDAPSEMMFNAWVAMGVAPERIVLERASRNTAENAMMTRDVIKPAPGQVHLLVTSAAHMPRAMASFERAGWTGLVAWPVDYRSGPSAWTGAWTLDEHLGVLNSALREYVGLFAYKLAGQ